MSPRRRRPTGTEGAAVVEFVLVTVLVVGLFLLVLQVGWAMHTRTVLTAAAAEGARFGANADRGESDAVARAQTAVAQALSGSAAAAMRYDARMVERGGLALMEVEVTGPMPLVFLPAGPLRITVRGHALEEQRS